MTWREDILSNTWFGAIDYIRSQENGTQPKPHAQTERTQNESRLN